MRGEVVALDVPRPPKPCAGGCVGDAAGVALWSSARDVYKAVSGEESTVLTMPWAPRIDVLFLPRELANVSGGQVRIFARTPGAELEIARGVFAPPDALTLTAAMGCEAYVIKASLTYVDPNRAEPIDSYVYARVYHGR